MATIGRLASITRYPVKSMAGEPIARAYLTPHGLQHDRLYAFESSAAPQGMLRLTSRERRSMLQHKASVDNAGHVEVTTPTGARHPVDAPELLTHLQTQPYKKDTGSTLTLTRAETPQTDVRPLSLLSLETVAALSAESGQTLDPRRFRANLLLTLNQGPFAEDHLIGQTLQIGEARLLIRERTPRCRFVTYDPVAPDEEEPLFSLMQLLDRRHQGRVGIYASVLTPGWIARDDPLTVLPESWPT